MLRQICLLLFIGALSLGACNGASNKSGDEANSASETLPAALSSGTAIPDLVEESVPQPSPPGSPIGSVDPTETAAEPVKSSLQDLIVGSWVSVDEEYQSYSLLAFSFDGRFLQSETVEGTYEVIGEHSVRITPNGNDEDFAEPTIITILEISPESMVGTGSFLDESETFSRAKGARNLAQEMVGFWRVYDASSYPENSYFPFPIMSFDANEEFVSYWQGTGIRYEVFNNSLILVADPSYDPLYFEEVNGDTAIVRFRYFEPAVSFRRLKEDKATAKYLVGLWDVGDEKIEFTEDSRAISQTGGEMQYHAFDDGTVLFVDPKAEQTLQPWKLSIKSDNVANLVYVQFDTLNRKFIENPTMAQVTLERITAKEQD